ncbi:MAG: hypothetical protein E6J91_19975 [Deltaproteobacteria bacterium]|nr:MAG: hypothetical protein E6J91_19975 [Deltaproteobacteria bacterium]
MPLAQSKARARADRGDPLEMTNGFRNARAAMHRVRNLDAAADRDHRKPSLAIGSRGRSAHLDGDRVRRSLPWLRSNGLASGASGRAALGITAPA